jgi:hypothetical protein
MVIMMMMAIVPVMPMANRNDDLCIGRGTKSRQR